MIIRLVLCAQISLTILHDSMPPFKLALTIVTGPRLVYIITYMQPTGNGTNISALQGDQRGIMDRPRIKDNRHQDTIRS